LISTEVKFQVEVLCVVTPCSDGVGYRRYALHCVITQKTSTTKESLDTMTTRVSIGYDV